MKYRKLPDGKWAPEVEQAKKRDPITLYSVVLQQKGIITSEQIDAMEEEINAEIVEAVATGR